MITTVSLVRQLSALEAKAARLSRRIELMHRAAEAAPTRAMMKTIEARGGRLLFHRVSREQWRKAIDCVTKQLGEVFTAINNLRARTSPESQGWDRLPSSEMVEAVKDTTLDRLIKADMEKQMATSNADKRRMNSINARRRQTSNGFNALFGKAS